MGPFRFLSVLVLVLFRSFFLRVVDKLPDIFGAHDIQFPVVIIVMVVVLTVEG